MKSPLYLCLSWSLNGLSVGGVAVLIEADALLMNFKSQGSKQNSGSRNMRGSRTMRRDELQEDALSNSSVKILSAHVA